MPLISTAHLLRIDAEWLAQQGFQKQWDEIENHPLGKNIGTRIITEMGEEWYTVATEISWWERENLNAKGAMDVKISARTAQRIAANGEMNDEEFSIPVQQNDDTAAKKLRYLETYLKAWCHGDGKPNTADLKRLSPLTAWALLEIIADIHKGQSLKMDTPFVGSLSHS